MTSKEYRLHLFQSHVADLKGVQPDLGDVFVCPICLRIFGENNVYDGTLTDGHVWPRYFRAKSKVAVQHRVLLCRHCNHTAATRGDKQMQLMEKVREGDDIGEPYGERRVQLVETPGKKPIELRVTVQEARSNTIKITGLWTRSNPEQRARFENLIKKSQPFDVVIHPLHGLRADLTEAGWITSAYLFAFRALGYRYILHESVFPVREYILKSLSKHDEGEETKVVSDDFGIMGLDDLYYQHPELALAIHLNDKALVRLEVSYLRYRIRLPFHFVPSGLGYLIGRGMSDIRKMLPELGEHDAYLYSPINCNKLDGHECIYDYVMGRPFP